jgi:hypothetical protein
MWGFQKKKSFQQHHLLPQKSPPFPERIDSFHLSSLKYSHANISHMTPLPSISFLYVENLEQSCPNSKKKFFQKKTGLPSWQKSGFFVYERNIFFFSSLYVRPVSLSSSSNIKTSGRRGNQCIEHDYIYGKSWCWCFFYFFLPHMQRLPKNRKPNRRGFAFSTLLYRKGKGSTPGTKV